ncbi:MAG TPA: hypothetical protein VFK76_08575, partial [Gaiellaceae bacterium]|nr:hypothetical protein [Gaiellaceae bacterium]
VDRAAFPSAEIEELRTSLAALSAQKLPKNIEGRVDDLKASVGVLAQRLETLSSTVSTTAAGLAGREGEVAAIRRQIEEANRGLQAEVASLRTTVDPAPLAELQASIKTLATETAALKRDDQRRSDSARASIEQLSARVEAATTALSETTTRVASSDQTLTALRAEYDQERDRVDTLLVRLHQATSDLSARVSELGGVASADSVEKLVADLGGVAFRVDELAATVTETASGYAAREYEIAALSRRFEEISTQVDAGVQELRASVQSIVERGADPELERRVEAFAGQLAAVEDGIAAAATAAVQGKDEAATAIAELDGRLSELASRLEAAAADSALEGRVDRLDAALGGLATELAKLGTTLSTRSAEAASSFGTLQTRLEELAALVPDPESASLVERRIADLATQLAAVVEESSARRDDVASDVSELGRRLAGLEGRLADADGDRAAADQRVEEKLATWADERAALVESARALEERVAELGTALSARSAEATGALEALETRLDELAARAPDPEVASRVESQIADLATQLAAVVEESSARRDDVASEVSELGRRLAGLEGRLADVDGDRAAADKRVEEKLATWADERASLVESARAIEERVAALGSTVDESAASVAALEASVAASADETAAREADVQALSDRFQESSARVDSLVAELQNALATMPRPVSADLVEGELAAVEARLEELEQTRGTAALEIARVSASWSEERTQIQEQIEQLVGSLAQLESRPPAADPVDEQRLAELAERLEHAERDRERLETEIAGATAFWSSGLGAMEARVTEIAAAKAASSRKVDDEVVRALFDLARRLDAVERASSEADAEVGRTAESWAAERQSLAAGLDELAQRLDSLGGKSTEPLPPRDDSNEGRARLELRALELRMEHAEAAARESREAVLRQLERLASRIEWRLQRLETGKDDGTLPETAAGPLAPVVSIHGGDA